MQPAQRKLLRSYAICFAVWSVAGLFFFTQGITQKLATHDPTPAWHYLVTWMTGVYVCALVTPGIFWLARRFPIERPKRLRNIALHFVFALIFSIGELALHAGILVSLGLFPTAMKTYVAAFAILIVVAFHQNVVTYWSLIGVEYALRYYRGYQERKQHALQLELQSSELRTQLVRAQLSALNMQLQPHFLFNTLNAIMVLVRQQKTAEAEQMLAHLSDLLRAVLEDVDAQEVPLRRDLEFLQLYLAIEQVRFQDRLHVEICADPAVLDAAIPHMALQPLVENAVRHGIGRSSSAGTIRITASRFADSLEIKVQDDGPGLPPEGLPSGHGIGLSNTQSRLQQLYGDTARLTLENDEPHGAVATLVLPFHLLSEEFHAVPHADR